MVAGSSLHGEPSELERALLAATLAYQFRKEASELLRGGIVKVRRSPSSGRVREVYVDGVLVGTIRATDGFFVPTLEGAARLLKLLSHPRSRVVVGAEVGQYVAQGRSVFCKHVIEADPEVRPGDEVFVVNTEGKLVAVGKAVTSGAEMTRRKAGRAVKVRKGILER